MLIGKRKAGPPKTNIKTRSKKWIGQQEISMIELYKRRAKQAAQKRAKKWIEAQQKASKEPEEEASTKPEFKPQKYIDLHGIEKTFGSDVMEQYKDNAVKVTTWEAVEPAGFLLGKEVSIVQNASLLTSLRKLAKHYRGRRKQKHQLAELSVETMKKNHIPFQIIVGGLFFEVTDQKHILESVKHRFRQIRSNPNPDDDGKVLGNDTKPSGMSSEDFQKEIDIVFKKAGYNLASSEEEGSDPDVALAPKQDGNAQEGNQTNGSVSMENDVSDPMAMYHQVHQVVQPSGPPVDLHRDQLLAQHLFQGSVGDFSVRSRDSFGHTPVGPSVFDAHPPSSIEFDWSGEGFVSSFGCASQEQTSDGSVSMSAFENLDDEPFPF